MALPQSELEFLDHRGLSYVVSEEASMTCVVLPAFPLPPGLNHAAADLLVRLSIGFPDVPPDMWWLSPAVHRLDGRPIPATEHVETHVGRSWQRWSRHLNAGQWRSGTDGLENYIAMIRRELEKCAQLELVS